MPGLNLGMQASGRVNVAGGSGSASATPVDATSAAFGSGYTSLTPSRASALKPNDPFGVAFWTGIGCLGLLLLIRYSLPN